MIFGQIKSDLVSSGAPHINYAKIAGARNGRRSGDHCRYISVRWAFPPNSYGLIQHRGAGEGSQMIQKCYSEPHK
jgi:hypothetical protein